jgi:trimethylamine--corrinoid protein Co-methyltransferase
MVTVRLQMLDEAEIESIHRSSLRILEEVGLDLRQPEALEILRGSGALVQERRVFLPGGLVERALALCPGTVEFMGRGGVRAVLGDGSTHWHNLGGAREIHDEVTGSRRPSGIREVIESTRLLDALDNVTTVTPFFTPVDVPGPIMALAMYRYALSNTTKPLHGPGVYTADEVRAIAEMAQVVGPPSEVLTLGISPVSPLRYPDAIVEAVLEVARLGIPLGPLPCPLAGATAPLSLAGTLAQQNAESLALLTLAELVRPGLPVFYCGRISAIDPRSGLSVWGGVEVGLAGAATVQLGHRYHLPANVYGFSTNSHIVDFQSGYERALNALLPALAGADELSGIGEIDTGVCGSYAQMVCDDELTGSIHRACRGIVVDEDALAERVIAEVIAGAGNFLGEKHSSRWLRRGEIFLTRIAERRPFAEWDRTGRDPMMKRAQATAQRLIAEHEVAPLDPAAEGELDRILNKAREAATER